MIAKIRNLSNRGRIIVAAAVFCLLLLFLTAGYFARVNSCHLASRLATDASALSGYLATVAAGRSGYGASGSLDPLSLECLACHDGVIAAAAHYRLSDGTLSQQPMSIVTIVGPHPLGMSYEKATSGRRFTPPEQLPLDMVLMYGNVGCVTCHNLRGSHDNYLAVDNNASRLCFSCHRI